MSVVEVRLVRVLPGAADDPVLLARLGPGDRDAIASLGFAGDRDRAVTARAWARLELGRRLGLEPRLVPLVDPAETGGRPVVRGADLGISWSHSGDWVALALAPARPVGVDIERVLRRAPVPALRLLGLGSMREFVAREAAGKVTGRGLAGPWPLGVGVRALPAPAGYVAAVASSGHEWSLDLGQPRAGDSTAAAAFIAVGAWSTWAGPARPVYAC